MKQAFFIIKGQNSVLRMNLFYQKFELQHFIRLPLTRPEPLG